VLGLALGLGMLWMTAAPTTSAWAESRASMQIVHEAWLAADAVVYGIHRGVSKQAGPEYHEIDVQETWMGTPSPGMVLFKAPRGIKAEPGDQVLLMLWDELNGATHAYLEKAQRNYGDALWENIGPDSVTTYLLPFSRFAFTFQKGKIDLRGTDLFGDPVKKRDLWRDLVDFEETLQPHAQFQTAEAVVECVVEERDFKIYEVENVPVEHRVFVKFRTGVVYKGDVPKEFSFEYGSFPRSPRFEKGDSVLLFLAQREGSWYLPHGKRGVFHIDGGQVLEAGQPLREFLKAMQAP